MVFMGILSKIIAQEVFDGYILFTPQIGFGDNSSSKLMDNDFNIIQSWDHSNGAASMPYLIPGDEPGWENTLLIYPYRVDNPTMESGGVGGAVQCLTWEGELIWEYTLSNNDINTIMMWNHSQMGMFYLYPGRKSQLQKAMPWDGK